MELPQKVFDNLERFRVARGFESHAEVVQQALDAMRDLELIEGYRRFASDYPDLEFADGASQDGSLWLEPKETIADLQRNPK